MNINRRILLPFTFLFIIILTWQAISGGLRQFRRSRTTGQKIETVVQLESGLLGLLVVLTCFWRRQWAAPVRRAWGISLATAAGLSSIVWGPPMPLLGIFFFAGALLVARSVIWLLDKALR